MRPSLLSYLEHLITSAFRSNPLAMLSGVFLVFAGAAGYILWRSLKAKQRE